MNKSQNNVKKILVINTFSARDGGGQTYLINILKQAKKIDDLEIILLITKGLPLFKTTKNIKTIEVKFPVSNPILRALWEKIYLPFLLKKLKADGLFCPGGVISTNFLGNCKTITSFQNMIPFDKKQRESYPLGYMRFRNWMLNKSMTSSMSNADLVIFISNYARNVIMNEYNINVKKSELIPHGVDFQHRRHLDEDITDIVGNKPYILYPSTIDVYKSQKEVIKAYSLLKKTMNDIPPLVFVGPMQKNNLAYAKEAFKLVEKLNLTEDIIFTGKVDYSLMPLIYKHSRLVIFASQIENCPNILLEAMSSGCMTLCSNYMPMPEFGIDGVVYFNPKNPDDLCNKLTSIFSGDFDESIYIERAQAYIENYKWEKAGEKTWNSIMETLN